MGMSIEDIIQGLKETYMICCSVFAYDRKKYIDGAIDRLHKYQKIQADYETRLKADSVVMLTELQLEIEEIDSRAGYDGYGMPTFSTDYIRKKKVNELIQQKINSLKEQP